MKATWVTDAFESHKYPLLLITFGSIPIKILSIPCKFFTSNVLYHVGIILQIWRVMGSKFSSDDMNTAQKRLKINSEFFRTTRYSFLT